MGRFLFLVSVIFCFVSKGQNLVPNPSFENHTDCINILLEAASPWCTSNSGIGNSAYLNPCHSDPLYQTPYQYSDPCFKSYQVPHSGVSYSDMASFVQSPVQESVVPQVKLIDTLEAGKIYCVTYYVSVFNNARYTIDKLGALLTPTPFPCFVAGGPTVAIAGNYAPQVVSTPSVAIGDTLNWTEVSGSFTAVGNEAHLAIGDFFTHSQHYILNKYPTNCNGLAYYYVDDVSVELVEIAKAKNDTLIYATDSVIIGNNASEAALFSWQPTAGLSCTNCPNPKASPNVTTTYTVTKTQCKSITTDVITVTVSPVGIIEVGFTNVDLRILPNPASDVLNITSRFGFEKIELLSITGQILLTELTTDKSQQLNLADFAEGIYFVKISYANGQSVTKKVIVNH
jgi:Secretion system C-terminal sorting domain